MTSLFKRVISKIRRKLNLDYSEQDKLLKLFKNKKGIEIGGPSAIFSSSVMPVYSVIKSLDGCNFSTSTVWEGSIQEGPSYIYHDGEKGYQYISEASNLDKIESEKYDFLLASHCLEHCANALKTVKEWLRIVKPGGYILLILPDRQYTFDHKRPITTFEHLLDDYNKKIEENDLTHLNEILQFHDLSLDIPAGDLNNFKERSLKNMENRCLHHHIFDFALLEEILTYCGVKPKYKKFIQPYHQIVFGVKK